MKTFLLILTLAISGCKTCEIETRIAEGFTKYVAVALECKNVGNLKADIKDMCSQHDFCSKDRIIPVEAVPSGSWSEAALSCLHVTGNIENLLVKNQARWGCKGSVLDPAELEKVCEKL